MIARLAAGDDAALEALFDQYGDLVYGIAAQLVGHEQADDITQEVFLGLWAKPDSFDAAVGSLRTFVALHARRRAIDHLRSAGRRDAREQRAGPEMSAPPDVEEAAIAMITSSRVRDALSALPADQRRAIELAYFGGLTCASVAKVCNIAEGTAKSRLRLGLGRLARELTHDHTSRITQP
jgi:RNA polymerase sigma-70 factor (ECF subfamily)